MKIWLAYTASPTGLVKSCRALHMARWGRESISAGTTCRPTPEQPLGLLLSYHYHRATDLRAFDETFLGVPMDYCADSGAFSAWTKGEPIRVEDYAEWLVANAGRWKWAAALDVIGSGVKSFQQTLRLRRLLEGTPASRFPLVPVFHSTDEGGLSFLEQYQAEGFDYIGISPTGSIYQAPRMMDAWVARCFRALRPGVRTHGFGVTSWPVLRRYPWTSADSTSWSNAFIYGQLVLFDDARGKIVRVDMRKRVGLLAWADLMATYGLRPTECQNRGYDGERMTMVAVETWRRAERFLNRAAARKRTA